jgi:ABC-type transport system involved in multi-copper enzyme maturation permease subunit
LTGEVLSTFLPDYFLQAMITFTSTLIAASYTAIAAMLSRSILGGVLIGFLFMLAETAILLPLTLIARLLDIPQLGRIYHFTPSYNLANISSWINQNTPYSIFSEFGTPHTLSTSALIVVLWVIGLIALTVYLFRRQDITN